jgi:hypothetical protein
MWLLSTLTEKSELSHSQVKQKLTSVLIILVCIKPPSKFKIKIVDIDLC